MRVEEPIAATEVDLQLWRDLYDLAACVWQLAPWKWMGEADVFGVEMPNGQVVFLSVMGALGEHRAIAVYPDAAALTSFWKLYDAGGAAEPERVLEIPQVQLSFETRQFLEKEDRGMMKKLGLMVDGKEAWPLFRSYRPGFVPWFIERGEANTLIVALKQLLDVAPRQRANAALIQKDDFEYYLIRALRKTGTEAEWTDEFREVPPDHNPSCHAALTADHVYRWRALAVVENEIEVDFFMMMRMPIREGKERPYYPYMLLLVDSQSGLILSQEMLTVKTSIAAMCASIPGKLVDQFNKLGIRPGRLTVRPGRLEAILRSTAEVLDIELRSRRKLSALDEVKRALFEVLVGGPL